MKALSYIVASILMLIITITLSGTAYLYISGVFTATVQGIEVADAYCSLGEVTISIRNIGTSSITKLDIEQTNPKDDFLTHSFQGTIEPGKTIQYKDTCEGEQPRKCIYRISPPAGKAITSEATCMDKPESLVLSLHFDEGFVRDDDNERDDNGYGDVSDDGANKWLIINVNQIQSQYVSLYIYGRATNCNATADSSYRIRVNDDAAKTISFNWCDIFGLDAGSALQSSGWQWVRFDIPRNWLINGENKFNFWDTGGACSYFCANWEIGVDLDTYYTRSGWCCNCGLGSNPPKGTIGTCGATANGELMMYLGLTGNKTLDVSNNNDGILGAGISGDIRAPQWIAGKYGSALSFDGVNDYVDAGTSAPNLVGTDFTISLWLYKRSDNPSWVTVLVANHQSSLGYSFELGGQLYGANVGKLLIRFQEGFEQISNTALANNAWYFVAVTYNWTTREVKYYINGTLDTTHTSTVDVQASSGAVTIGARPGPAYLLDGLIDEVRIYNKAIY